MGKVLKSGNQFKNLTNVNMPATNHERDNFKMDMTNIVRHLNCLNILNEF